MNLIIDLIIVGILRLFVPKKSPPKTTDAHYFFLEEFVDGRQSEHKKVDTEA